jgi:hypothetical protein
LALIERDQCVNQAFGVHPAQGMQQNGELSGAIADNDPFA